MDRNRQQVIGSIGTHSGSFGLELDVTYGGDVAAAMRAVLSDGLRDFTGGDLFFAPAVDTPHTYIAVADAPVDAVTGHIDL